MINVLLGLLAATVFATQGSGNSRPASRPVPAATNAPAAAIDPVEQAYEKLLEQDEAAQQEVDKWIKEAQAFKAKGAPFSNDALNLRIEQRFAPVKKAYEDFIQLHPDHIAARLAYGSFLYETEDEDAGVAQWEKARDLDPKNPAAWNNLGNHYGHRGPVDKAFSYYAKAIELKPDEPVYLQNLATTVYLFRKDAMEYYHCDEKQVFDRSLELYKKALKLDPTNFPLATDYAQSYYGIKPLRTNDALSAWNYALKIASDDFEREGVYVHLARVEINAGLYDEARKHLNQVTNDFYKVLKDRLARNMSEKQKGPVNSAAAPANASIETPASPPPTASQLLRAPHPRSSTKP